MAITYKMGNSTEMNTLRTYSSNKSLVTKRRKQVVQTATKIFYEKGYHGTTMRELAKTCNLTTGALYHYFRNKDEILHLIVKSYADHGLTLRTFRRKFKNASVAEALHACIEKYYKIVDDDGDTILFFNREIRKFNKSDRDYLLKRQVDVVEFFNSLLTAGIETGEFKVNYPTLLIAHNILMLGQIYVTRRWFLKKRYTLQEYTRMQADIMLKEVLQNSNLTKYCSIQEEQ